MNILTYLTNEKYRFFSKKIKSVQYAIWDLDFKVMKLRQVREEVRLDRDREVEALGRAKQALEVETDKEKKKLLEADIATLEDNKKRFEIQMGRIDQEVSGYTAKDDSEQSVVGIMEQLQSYADLRKTYKKYRDAI